MLTVVYIFVKLGFPGFYGLSGQIVGACRLNGPLNTLQSHQAPFRWCKLHLAKLGMLN